MCTWCEIYFQRQFDTLYAHLKLTVIYALITSEGKDIRMK